MSERTDMTKTEGRVSLTQDGLKVSVIMTFTTITEAVAIYHYLV